jgi:hypothetical protein
MTPAFEALIESWRAIAADSRWSPDYRNAHRHCLQELAELLQKHQPEDTTP